MPEEETHTELPKKVNTDSPKKVNTDSPKISITPDPDISTPIEKGSSIDIDGHYIGESRKDIDSIEKRGGEVPPPPKTTDSE